MYGQRIRFINRCGTSLTTGYIFLLAFEENSIAEREKCGVKVLRKKKKLPATQIIKYRTVESE